jgi:hypothetical protein
MTSLPLVVIVQRVQLGPEGPRLLRSVFGVGTVRGRGGGVYYFEVTTVTGLVERVFPFLDRFPLRGAKRHDLGRFRRIAALIQVGRHLSPGFEEILSVRAPMSRGASAGVAMTSSSLLCEFGILRGHTQGSLLKQRDEDMVHAS